MSFVKFIRIKFLISHHDDTEHEVRELNDPELDVLVAADTLTFFGSAAELILEKFGPTELAGKVKFMISKMPKRFRKILNEIKLENKTVETIKQETLASLEGNGWL